MNAVVFAGPSLFGIDRARLQGVELRPPAGKGDLLAAGLGSAKVIGLIDGTFEFGAATWHKEILFVLDRGVHVFGAASMGALRAAECAAFGMVGVGHVYADYAMGRRWADADVAIMHAPAAMGYRPLTEALVDIDATLRHAQDQGYISARQAERLGKAARATHFKDRTWPQLVAQADIETSEAEEILKLLYARRRSVKSEDALALIEVVRDVDPAASPQPRLPAPFNHTMFFEELLSDVQAQHR
jgi:hypothetical protein